MRLFSGTGAAAALAVLVAAASGCGGEQHEAHHGGEHAGHEKHGEHAHGEHAGHGEHGHHHHDMAGPVGELHAMLAPVWHSEPGAGRVAKACDEAATMRERAAAVESAPAPEGASADAYGAAAKALTAAGDALVAACAADGRPDAEAKLTAFHDAFHEVMEQTGGKPHHH